MTTRREFFRLAAQSATAAVLVGDHSAGAEQNEADRVTPRRGRSLLDLQQRFADLRFGMFVHFNIATFQDRECGDPTSPPDLFHPAALDTDQWAAAAQSANMTWGCLTAYLRNWENGELMPEQISHLKSMGMDPDTVD